MWVAFASNILTIPNLWSKPGFTQLLFAHDSGSRPALFQASSMWTLSFQAYLATYEQVVSDHLKSSGHTLSWIAMIANFCKHSSLLPSNDLFDDVSPLLWGRALRLALQNEQIVLVLNESHTSRTSENDDMEIASGDDDEGDDTEITQNRGVNMMLEPFIDLGISLAQQECIDSAPHIGRDLQKSLTSEVLDCITQQDFIKRCMNMNDVQILSQYVTILQWTSPTNR